MDDHSEGSSTPEHARHGTGEYSTNGDRCMSVFFSRAMTADWRGVGQVSIDILPDDVLVDIFDLHIHQAQRYSSQGIETWRTLVHVSRRWRNVALGSPRRLNLRIFYTAGTPVSQLLDVWPSHPIVIRANGLPSWDLDNLIAALKHNDRACVIQLWSVPSSLLELVSAAMQDPFPELTELEILSRDNTPPVVPDSFLGGSAPRLRSLWLDQVPFPGLPKLLSSCPNLVELSLWRIPLSGYFSPEAMATVLSNLTRLETFDLKFQTHQSLPDQNTRRPPPPMRAVLPALKTFSFRGVSEYLEHVLPWIDSPRLDFVSVYLHGQSTNNITYIYQFISHSKKLKVQSISITVSFIKLTLANTDVSRCAAPRSGNLTRNDGNVGVFRGVSEYWSTSYPGSMPLNLTSSVYTFTI